VRGVRRRGIPAATSRAIRRTDGARRAPLEAGALARRPTAGGVRRAAHRLRPDGGAARSRSDGRLLEGAADRRAVAPATPPPRPPRGASRGLRGAGPVLLPQPRPGGQPPLRGGREMPVRRAFAAATPAALRAGSHAEQPPGSFRIASVERTFGIDETPPPA